MSIKIYPNEVEAVDSTGAKLFTICRFEDNVYRIDINTLFSKDGLDKLFDEIRAAVELMETEIEK